MSSHTLSLRPMLDYRDLPEGTRVDQMDVAPESTLLFPVADDDGIATAVCVVQDGRRSLIRLAKPLRFQHLQMLSDGRLLLVASRSGYLGDGRGDANAHVVATDGTVLDSFCLGDGICHVCTTRDDLIWVAYFDEGVLGSGDWRRPIGKPGLIAWNTAGKQVYALDLPAPLPRVVDGYALDISCDEVWFSYYPDFPLVYLKNLHFQEYWRCPVAGAHAMVNHEGLVLYSPGFGKDRHYRLFRLEAGRRMAPLGTFSLLGLDDEPLHHVRLRGRGAAFYLVGKTGLYRLAVVDLLHTLPARSG